MKTIHTESAYRGFASKVIDRAKIKVAESTNQSWKQFIQSQLTEGALARRRSNFQGNQFLIATEVAKKVVIAPIRNKPFNRNRMANWNKPSYPLIRCNVPASIIPCSVASCPQLVWNLSQRYPKTSTWDIMLGMNLWGTIYNMIYMFSWPCGSGFEAVQFCRQHPEAAWDIFFFCLYRAVGQILHPEAVLQVEEETGVKLKMADMVDLTAFLDPSIGCRIFPSPGGCDEELSLFLYQVNVDNKVITTLHGKQTGLHEHGELIKVCVVPYDKLWHVTVDAKVLAAITLYEMAKRDGLLPK